MPHKNSACFFFLFLFLSTFCFSCKEQSVAEHPILRVSSDEKTVSVFDLFQEVKIIPLTTSEESLLANLDKIIIHNDTIYIFDRRLYALYRFDSKGRFIDKIQRVGRGPGEYLVAYDFTLNTRKNSIDFLYPAGAIYSYSSNGTYIETHDLPHPPMNYQYFEMMDSGHYVTWSREDSEDTGALNVFNSESFENEYSYFHYSSLWGTFRHGSLFHKYENNIYYHETLAGKVYRITSNGYQTAYEWDMGIRLVNPQRFRVPENRLYETQQKLIEEVKRGDVPFWFGKQFQNDKYYYTILVFFHQTQLKSLFYNKLTGENFLFQKTSEGIQLDLKYMTDDYALGVVNFDDKEAFRSAVSPEDAVLLDEMKEDDNTWLVKYVFKE